MAKIADNIYLGSFVTASDNILLKSWNIKCIANVARGCNNLLLHEYDYLRVPFEDDSYIPKDILDDLVDLIHKYVTQGLNVLIHCWKGKSRSVFVVAYYLVKFNRYDVKTVLDMIKEKKADIKMSPIFVDQLNEYVENNKITIPLNLVNRVKNVISENYDKSQNIRKSDVYSNMSDDDIKKLILKHKKVKYIEQCIKENRIVPNFIQINYVITISKKTNYHIPDHA